MDAIKAATNRFLNADPVTHHPLQGGDLSKVSALTLSNGRLCVAKTGPLVAVEARMLKALRQAGAPTPRVLGQAGQVLLLEHLHEAAATESGWASLGASLHALHQTHGPSFGWHEDYGFGPLAIRNTPQADWPAFWAENRLLPTIADLPTSLRRRVETLCKHLPEILPARPPAALLHGDLWAGNVLFSGDSAHLIDPACTFGDAEVDLAMLHLFATPPAAFHAAYGPLLPGWETRRAAYQLWPALVHVRLFGAGYHGLVDTCLSRLGF
ncbi:MAG TPA: aminoglycoside phosphotransferase [Aliiroseovarius sp.]|nr:aminoglycoside phosphotransferase [Aliiroseovarius sp.]